MVPADARAEVVLLRDGTEVASWPLVCEGGKVDLRVVDALARLQLTAQRLGCRIRLYRAHRRLRELLALAGLADVLPLQAGSAVEPGRQAEQGEQAIGVEEGVEPTDPAG